MEIIRGNIEGIFKVILKPNADFRGSFFRTYDENIFKEAGLHRDWIQENHSVSVRKNTVRGLHLQLNPKSETKLVRCISGSVFDVFVDLRHHSPTFGKWDSLILSEEKNNMIYIPRGFAHGVCSLTDGAHILYKVDNPYSPEYELGLLWNDPDLAIDWPLEGEPILSEKDKRNMSFKEFVEVYGGLDIGVNE